MTARRSAATLIVAALAAPAAAAAAPPPNDHYLAAQDVNAPGSDLPRDAVTLPPVDTSEATLQSDLFAPPAAGGPPEPFECATRGTTPYDRTVWYALHPDTDGRVEVSATGFDAVVAVVPFAGAADRTPQGYECANDSDGLVERLTVAVEAGMSYAVQVGGVRTGPGAVWAGPMQLGVRFDADRDADGVSDDDDRCPDRRGTENGCPPSINATISYRWRPAPNGVRLEYLRVVGAPSRATIRVRCKPRCKSARVRAAGNTTDVKPFAGRVLRAGTTVHATVTRGGYFGFYQALRIKVNDIAKQAARCLTPGSSKPRTTCR